MKLEFVTHCYACKLPHFAGALYTQLASICNNASDKHESKCTVFYYGGDEYTCNVLKLFEDDERHKSAEIVKHELPLDKIGRRSIGRHIAAQETDADILWFVDVDYWFGPALVDDLCNIEWGEGVALTFPRIVKVIKTHEMGDKLLKRYEDVYLRPTLRPPIFPSMSESLYVDQHFNRAIGGIQIVTGDYARQYGYLPNTGWQRPTATPFRDTREDVAFRKAVRSTHKASSVLLKDVYRIRHSASPLNDHRVPKPVTNS